MRPALRILAVLLAVVWASSIVRGQAAPTPTARPKALDFETFRTKIQPIFLAKRGEHARCYSCHSQGTPLRLQELSPGATAWTEEQSRANFTAVQRVVVPGQPTLSPLLLMPLAHEAGGTEFHPGGKHFLSMDDPEAKTIIAWINDVNQ
jgi:hypothetical protein